MQFKTKSPQMGVFDALKLQIWAWQQLTRLENTRSMVIEVTLAQMESSGVYHES